MNCDEVRIWLDRPSGDEGAPALEAHIENCRDCRRYRDAVAAIRNPRSVLQRDIQPERDLWPGIESRLARAVEFKSHKRSHFLPLAAAAGIAAIALASLISLPPIEEPAVATIAIDARHTTPKSPRVALPVDAVEVGFAQTRAVLLKRFERQKRSAPAEQIAFVERTLFTMDLAVRDIHAALERDPHNASLLFKLTHTRRRELRLLQQVVL